MITSPVFRLGRSLGVERCDRCDARATVLALLYRGGKLYFCGYHATMHHAALDGVAECFEDPAARIPQPAAPALV